MVWTGRAGPLDAAGHWGTAERKVRQNTMSESGMRRLLRSVGRVGLGLWLPVLVVSPVLAGPAQASLEPHSPPASSVKADYILVEKSKRRLTLIARGRVLKSYRIALGRNPKGPKVREGDNRTPEGRYVIDYRLRDSDYHLALHISYPNRYDRERARRLGVSPGGDIMIHGIGSAAPKVADLHPLFDWTNGCIAVTDREIEEIWRLTAVGTVVNIVP